MRIAVAINYAASLYHGGAEVQAKETVKALRELGHEVFLYSPPWEEPLEADVVHLFGPDLSLRSLAQHLRGRVPLCISPIAWLYGSTLREALSRKVRYSLVSWVQKHRGPVKGVINAWERRNLTPRWYFSQADVLLPNSKLEAQMLERFFGVSTSRMVVVHHGVDSSFGNGDPELFRKQYGIWEPFVLCVAYIYPDKNQLRLIKALRDFVHPLVLVGKQVDQNYAEACRRYAGPNVRWIGELRHDDPLLRSAYAAARVFVLPSLRETRGLGALETAAAGCPVLITEVGTASEYFGSDALYVNPLSTDDNSTQN